MIKKRLLYMIIISFLILSFVILCIAAKNYNAVALRGHFDLAEYPLYEDTLPDNRKIGLLPDAETAAIEANKLWKEVYGREFHGRISVKYDDNNGCWLVSGELSLFDFLFFPNAIIKEDGTVLSIWLGQF